MDISNEGSSLYHGLLGLFQRRDSHTSLAFGSTEVVNKHWPLISAALGNSVTTETQANLAETNPHVVSFSIPDHGCVTAYQLVQPDTKDTVGLVLRADPQCNKTFEVFFTTLLLSQLRLCLDAHPDTLVPNYHVERLTETIVDIFDTRLRYAGINDQWGAVGRACFKERVRHFVSRGAKLEFCLPAFPCKSSNTNKVLGTLPDRGEALALEWLHAFVEVIEEVYPPGAKLWVVSDGHVFSDCIGADDSTVDDFTAQLIDLNNHIAKPDTDRVGFKSLVDIFSLSDATVPLQELSDHLDLADIPHHFPTELTFEAELCRRILMSGSHASRAAVRARIQGQDKSILALYRGFSKFMLEDLELHPATQTWSKTKRRKVATAVSFEMIMRNQAYSNLVEMVFPNHIRLSIHAHPNCGPKFGITLFDRSRVRTASSLSLFLSPPATLSPGATSSSSTEVSRQTCTDLLHIPTPWHNSVVELSPPAAEGIQFIITKSSVARQAVSNGEVEGEVEGDELMRFWKVRRKDDVVQGTSDASYSVSLPAPVSEGRNGDVVAKVAKTVAEDRRMLTPPPETPVTTFSESLPSTTPMTTRESISLPLPRRHQSQHQHDAKATEREYPTNTPSSDASSSHDGDHVSHNKGPGRVGLEGGMFGVMYLNVRGAPRRMRGRVVRVARKVSEVWGRVGVVGGAKA